MAMFVADQTLDVFLRGALLTTAGLLWVIILIRINGLRSLSKMTSFDFIMTVAMGSLVAGAGQASEWSAFVQAIVAMAALFVVQWIAAKLRKESDSVKELVQNEPVLLMRDGTILYDALDQTRVTEGDLVAKLREANVLDFKNVRAAILETTGDVSVLHGDHLNDDVLAGVKQA